MPIPIPFLIYGGITLISGAASIYAYKKTDLFKTKKKINLAVIGLKGSGKTTLQNYLRNQNNQGPTPLSSDDASEGKIIKGKKVIIIRRGLDVSGNNEAIMHQYEDLIIQNDHIILIVDSSKLSNSKTYLKLNRGLLNKINKVLQDSTGVKKVLLIGSHKDQLDKKTEFDDAKLLNNFNGINQNISQTFLVNLTSQKDLKYLKKSLFA